MTKALSKGQVLIEVVSGAEGPSLYISDNDTGQRIAGPKPWGGGTRLHQFRVSVEELIKVAKAYGGRTT